MFNDEEELSDEVLASQIKWHGRKVNLVESRFMESIIKRPVSWMKAKGSSNYSSFTVKIQHVKFV